jgi:ABC-type lipoprotein release transport system permease subunit
MLWRLALRNIWRNKRRTALTVSAMVVSSSLLILSLGIFSGMLSDMLASATEQYYGHLVVSVTGYQDDRDFFDNFSPDPELLEGIASNPGVRGISPRLRTFGLVSHGQRSDPAEILGVEPASERQVTRLQEKIVAGSYLAGDPEKGALLGRGLAERLGVNPGDELVFVTQAADGSIGNDLFTVQGIFSTGDSRHDNGLVLVGLLALQQLTVLPDRVHELAASLEDPMTAGATAAQLNARLPAGLEATDWGQLLPEMQEAITASDVSRLIIVTILYFATGLGILNTFFMSVMERTREFGILMALGMRPWRVRAMVLLETLAMGGVSLSLGISLGLVLSLYMATVGIDLSATITPITYAGGTIAPRLRVVMEPANFIIPSLLLLAVCLLAGFLPANRAAGLDPVAAIRED